MQRSPALVVQSSLGSYVSKPVVQQQSDAIAKLAMSTLLWHREQRRTVDRALGAWREGLFRSYGNKTPVLVTVLRSFLRLEQGSSVGTRRRDAVFRSPVGTDSELP